MNYNILLGVLLVLVFIVFIALGYLYFYSNSSKKKFGIIKKPGIQMHEQCIITKQQYPVLKHIFDQKQIIIDELHNLLNSNKWAKWDPYNDKIRTPSFTKMTDDEIIKRIEENKNHLNTGKSSWRLFGLMLHGNIIEDNSKLCPLTMKLIQTCGPSIISVGISCLEPNVETHLHCDYDKSFYRCHIPLVIPDGDCGFQIGDKVLKWNMNDYFVFDDTCYHNAWNNTNSNRFILIVDIKR
jgi:hypothetical protein